MCVHPCVFLSGMYVLDIACQSMPYGLSEPKDEDCIGHRTHNPNFICIIALTSDLIITALLFLLLQGWGERGVVMMTG